MNSELLAGFACGAVVGLLVLKYWRAALRKVWR